MEVLQQDNQYIIKIPMDLVDASTLETLLRDLRLREILAQRTGLSAEADALAREVNSDWWAHNKSRFLDEDAGR